MLRPPWSLEVEYPSMVTICLLISSEVRQVSGLDPLWLTRPRHAMLSSHREESLLLALTNALASPPALGHGFPRTKCAWRGPDDGDYYDVLLWEGSTWYSTVQYSIFPSQKLSLNPLTADLDPDPLNPLAFRLLLGQSGETRTPPTAKRALSSSGNNNNNSYCCGFPFP
jgi:hypothetical protein